VTSSRVHKLRKMDNRNKNICIPENSQGTGKNEDKIKIGWQGNEQK